MALVQSVFGTAIDCEPVRIHRRRWFPFQPRGITMAPMGHLHFHPAADHYCDDYAAASLALQGHFIHEMTHVWQSQQRGRWHLILRRPFSRRYGYTLEPGKRLADYGIEQQAEIVRHAFLARHGWTAGGAGDLADYRAILPDDFNLKSGT